jgi:hypothetical protein
VKLRRAQAEPSNGIQGTLGGRRPAAFQMCFA